MLVDLHLLTGAKARANALPRRSNGQLVPIASESIPNASGGQTTPNRTLSSRPGTTGSGYPLQRRMSVLRQVPHRRAEGAWIEVIWCGGAQTDHFQSFPGQFDPTPKIRPRPAPRSERGRCHWFARGLLTSKPGLLMSKPGLNHGRQTRKGDAQRFDFGT